MDRAQVFLPRDFTSVGVAPIFPALLMDILINILLVVHVLTCLLMVLVVLMQRPKNEGLGAAFGGGMTDNLFGAQTTNVLQNFTRYLAGIFLGLTLLLAVLYAKRSHTKGTETDKLLAIPVPTASATPAPDASASPAASPAASPEATAAAAIPEATPVASPAAEASATPAN